jgi:ribosomal protein L11 methyltransferase
MKLYHAYHLQTTDEMIIALLSQFEFESFEQNDDHIVAYFPSDELTIDVEKDIAELLTNYNVPYSSEQLENKNWNEVWEASFQPVVVDGFCRIRADFHPSVDDVKHDIVINPKMAFGTGHHATTHMMVAAMEEIDHVDKSVYDFGCGTGILAVLAAKLGAAEIDAVDIEHESYVNTIENADINNITNIKAYCGEMAVVPHRQYDIILANINRNILQKYASELKSRTVDHGILLLSGILDDDGQQVIESFEQVGYQHLQTYSRNGWLCIKFNG